MRYKISIFQLLRRDDPWKNSLVNRFLQVIQDAGGRVNENPKVRNPGTEAYTFPNDELEVRRDENKLRYENNVIPRKLPKPEQNK